MLISPAFAQSAGGDPSGGIMGFLPLILIFVVFYFLLIRPQQKRAKQHKEMVNNVRRGDKVVTGGGIYGTVTKVNDDETITVEIAENMKVKVMKATLMDVVNKTEPVANDDDKGDKGDKADDAKADDSKSGGLKGLLGGKSKD